MEVFCLVCKRKFKKSELTQLKTIKKGKRIRLAALCPTGHKVSRFIAAKDVDTS